LNDQYKSFRYALDKDLTSKQLNEKVMGERAMRNRIYKKILYGHLGQPNKKRSITSISEYKAALK